MPSSPPSPSIAGAEAHHPRVWAVLVNWNGHRDTLACLASLREVAWSPFEIVVVDNGSTDGSSTALQEAVSSNVHLVEVGANLGYAGGNNLGIRHALEHGADFVWLLNNDTVVDPGSVAALVDRMREDPTVGMCGSTLLYHDAPATVQAYGGASYDPWTTRTKLIGQFDAFDPERMDRAGVERRLDMVSGASLFVSRDFLESVGPMSEDYFLFFEELDWKARARHRFRLGWAPESLVLHKEGSASGTSRRAELRSEVADYYGVRSRILYTRRHAPWALPSVVLSLVAVILNRLRRRQYARIPLLLGAALSGLVNGSTPARLQGSSPGLSGGRLRVVGRDDALPEVDAMPHDGNE